MQKVTEALAEWVSTAVPAYDQNLYPHQYAMDFLTGAGRTVIPQEIRHRVDRMVMTTPNAQGQQRRRRHPDHFMARLMLNAWLEETGEDEEAVYRALADKYLDAHGMSRP
ncbi:hypothetical protein AB0O01_21225 [Streptomyces sp. NPDC093252]|uniref:hypothetical protein n=1 Tax=Streptomyces sp. NPDC093252 TaxID=3154980 RepID=UPI003447C592